MPKMTKKQARNMVAAIDAKADRLFLQGYITTAEYTAMGKTIVAAYKRISKQAPRK